MVTSGSCLVQGGEAGRQAEAREVADDQGQQPSSLPAPRVSMENIHEGLRDSRASFPRLEIPN